MLYWYANKKQLSFNKNLQTMQNLRQKAPDVYDIRKYLT